MVLDNKSTWVVAAVCTIIVAVSFSFERLIHFAGKYLKKNNRKPLFDALLKVKEELMLLGFISLLLAVFEEKITQICVHENHELDLLPCDLTKKGGSENSLHCAADNKFSLLTREDLHQMHLFIFVLGIVHVTFSVLTVVIGGARIRRWKQWEDSFANESTNESSEQEMLPKFTFVREDNFIKNRFTGLGKYSTIIGWLQCFLKQFYGSVSKFDYEALRRGFITTHCRENPKFNFNQYMLRALEYDFKKVVGISWYLWVFTVIILLLNLSEWYADFGIAFIPFILLLAIGTKLEHVITQLAHDVAEKHTAIEGELVIRPSDDHFWFRRPRIILYMIHFILFQNACEITLLCWFLFEHGVNSCIVKTEGGFVVARLIIGAIIRLVCSYNTLPLYALVTQMGTHIKKSVFDEHVQARIVGGGGGGGSTIVSAPGGIHMGGIGSSSPEEGNPSAEIREV